MLVEVGKGFGVTNSESGRVICLHLLLVQMGKFGSTSLPTITKIVGNTGLSNYYGWRPV